jgi:hypothetical protein
MKRQGYKFGVAWVAENDNAGNGDSLDDIAGYVTTLLLADLFGKDSKDVARDIHEYRTRKQ